MSVFPLSYSIPDEIFEETSSLEINKEFKMSPLVPGKLDTYIYNTEQSYYEMYRKSQFGLTCKKGGWDCLRHYEILASKCIPYFSNLQDCPVNTMKNFPKELIIEVNKKLDDRTLTEDEYNFYLDKIFCYSKNNLTCSKNGTYFLETLIKLNNFNKPLCELKVLFLSGTLGYRNVNYSRELLAIGLRKLLGVNFIDYPQINILYKDCENKEKYVGKGFTYGGRLDNITIDRNNIEERISNKEFDLVVYGKVGKKIKKKKGTYMHQLYEHEYWDIVKANYDKNQIVFVYGGDSLRNIDNQCIKMHSQNGICFVREFA